MADFGNITPVLTNKADSGTIIAAGYRTAAWINAGATNVTVLGRVYAPGQGECLPAVAQGTYGPITYDANGGTIWFTFTTMP